MTLASGHGTENLVEHLERTLGSIGVCWTLDPDSPTPPIRIPQEMPMLAATALRRDHVASVPLHVGEMTIGMERALLRDDVICSAGTHVPVSDVTGLSAFVRSPSQMAGWLAI